MTPRSSQGPGGTSTRASPPRPASRGADTLPGGKRLFLPLRTGSGLVGVLGIDREAPGPLLTPDGRRLLDALCDQAAVAIERISLAKGLDEARVPRPVCLRLTPRPVSP